MEQFLYLYLFIVPLLLLWAVALWDNWRRTSRSAGAKIAWSAAVLLLPVVGVAVYFATRPVPPPNGRERPGEATTSGIVDELRELQNAHGRSDLDDEEFAAEKARLFGLSDPLAT